MFMLKMLLIAAGAFLNRLRGGLFDFGGNKLLFPLFLALVSGSGGSFVCIFVAAYVGQQFGWGTYIGALYGTPPAQSEVPQIDEIVNALVKAIEKPVTVKIRKGFDDEHVNAVEIAKIIEEAGASAVAVHGRTREQYYSGKADWDIIRQVKEATSIPVIGNGDVTSPQKAEELVRQTGCDGIMIARGAEGNPWIFSEMIAYEETGVVPPRPDKDAVREMMLRHARLQLQYKGEYCGIREMRKHVAWYTKGLKGASRLREQINRVESYDELEALLRTL